MSGPEKEKQECGAGDGMEKQQMLRSEIEKDKNFVDDFHDDLNKKLKGHPRFHELVQEMSRLHSKKNHDYAGIEKPLNNLKEVEGMGISAWIGVGVRISDKYTRMKNFIKNRKFEFKAESFKDTMMDMAVYALLCIILFEEEQKSKESFLYISGEGSKAKPDLKVPEKKMNFVHLCSGCKKPMQLVHPPILSGGRSPYYQCNNMRCDVWTLKQ